MEQSEKVWIASKYAENGYSYEDLKYGDDLYRFSGDEKETLLDEISELMTEYRETGSNAFREKYKEFKLY